ncbi:hypothetical protein BABINDRAFT_159763 [Babjeviella inositovora NRRL Y-12698]|uniref:Uncharacterized protein n=1 Tax=Babjeviella inositovora NRRL Y-12698 TaxID=984486 RepID=A0A1E3QV56_9ASCO|nr:uncharacterized protein BABINDRAFT_159763 [Babjeviella inositovora NRRL Y-12698]ODQ81484.1 hypothetical protein BABINDRAFT_159763 [Babjeviella inositovora NRRL Y-12698]
MKSTRSSSSYTYHQGFIDSSIDQFASVVYKMVFRLTPFVENMLSGLAHKLLPYHFYIMGNLPGVPRIFGSRHGQVSFFITSRYVIKCKFS